MKTLLISVTLLLSHLALGESVTLSWTPPTKNEDGTELTDLAGYAILVKSSPTGEPVTVHGFDNPALSQATIDVPPGEWWFTIASYDTSDNYSRESNTAFKRIVAHDENFDTVTTKVYTLNKKEDDLIFVHVGNVPLGTPCDPNVQSYGKYAIKNSVNVVSWIGTVRPVVVFGDCS